MNIDTTTTNTVDATTTTTDDESIIEVDEYGEEIERLPTLDGEGTTERVPTLDGRNRNKKQSDNEMRSENRISNGIAQKVTNRSNRVYVMWLWSKQKSQLLNKLNVELLVRILDQPDLSALLRFDANNKNRETPRYQNVTNECKFITGSEAFNWAVLYSDIFEGYMIFDEDENEAQQKISNE